MAKLPTFVHRHKIALIEEFGFTNHDALEDGFDEYHFDVVGDRRDDTPLRTDILLASDMPVRTRIYWPDAKTQARARQAMEDDYRETIGDAGHQAVQELNAQQQRWARH